MPGMQYTGEIFGCEICPEIKMRWGAGISLAMPHNRGAVPRGCSCNPPLQLHLQSGDFRQSMHKAVNPPHDTTVSRTLLSTAGLHDVRTLDKLQKASSPCPRSQRTHIRSRTASGALCNCRRQSWNLLKGSHILPFIPLHHS